MQKAISPKPQKLSLSPLTILTRVKERKKTRKRRKKSNGEIKLPF